MASRPPGRPPKLERNEKVVELVRGGASVSNVAEWFQISTGRVSQILARYGVKAWDHKKVDPSPTQEKVVGMLGEGRSQAAIARELGVSRQRVNVLVQKAKERGWVDVDEGVEL